MGLAPVHAGRYRSARGPSGRILSPSAALTACAAGLLAGCLAGAEREERAVRVQVEILRAEAPKASPKTGIRPVGPLGGGPGMAAGPSWSSDPSIASFKFPVTRIRIHNASYTRSADLHVCKGSGVDCQVEGAGQALRDELGAAAARVEPDEYRYLSVRSCGDGETEFTSALTATVALGGRDWHTHSSAVLDTVGPARPIYIKSRICERTFALPQPLRIAADPGQPLSLKLYFDLDGLAHAGLGSLGTVRAWDRDHCAGKQPGMPGDSDAPGPPFVCVGYPDFSGLIDSQPAVLEKYRINGGATLGLFFQAGTGQPVGGFTRLHFQEGENRDPGFPAGTPLRDLARNADGTLNLAAFGGGTTGRDGSVFRVEAFRRDTHAGTFTGLADTLGIPVPGSYGAVRLTASP